MKRPLAPIILIGTLALSAVVLAGCGSSEAEKPKILTMEAPAGAMQKYTESDSKIIVQNGGRFEITLPVNPSTGYSWQVTFDDGVHMISSKINPPVEKPAESDEAMSAPVGGATTQDWVFGADRAGTTKIEFSLMPPGSNTKAAEKNTFTVTIAK